MSSTVCCDEEFLLFCCTQKYNPLIFKHLLQVFFRFVIRNEFLIVDFRFLIIISFKWTVILWLIIDITNLILFIYWWSSYNVYAHIPFTRLVRRTKVVNITHTFTKNSSSDDEPPKLIIDDLLYFTKHMALPHSNPHQHLATWRQLKINKMKYAKMIMNSGIRYDDAMQLFKKCPLESKYYKYIHA